MEEYKINSLNHLKVSSVTILWLFMPMTYMYLLSNNQVLNLGAVLFMIPLLIIFALPGIYLHIEYYFHDKKTILAVNEFDGDIQYKSKKMEYNFKINNIEKVIVYSGPFLKKDNTYFLPFELYHFAKFIVNENGKKNEIIITSLLMPRIEEELYKIDITSVEIQRRVFTSIYMK